MGKSLAILLTSIFLTKSNVKNVILASSNITKRALESHTKKLIPCNFTIIELFDLERYLGHGYVFLVDEYPKLIVSIPAQFDSHGKLDGLHRLGHSEERMAAFSAHNSEGWQKFVREAFQDHNYYIHHSPLAILKEKQAFHVNVTCCSKDQQATLVVQKALDWSQSYPVIVFANKSLKLDFKNRPQGLYFKQPKDENEIVDCLAAIKKMTLGVLVFDFSQAFGLDPRFKVDAKVVVAHHESIDFETVG